MFRRFIALICVVLMIMGSVCSCGLISPKDDDTEVTTTADGESSYTEDTGHSGDDTSYKEDTGKEDDTSKEDETTAVQHGGKETQKPDEKPSLPIFDPEKYPDPDKEGTLLYYENFESYGTVKGRDNTAKALGWKVMNQCDNAYADNSCGYDIVRHGNGHSLYIENYTKELYGNDSYIRILSDEQFGYAHRHNYTYQYDIEYEDAGDTQRYIALVSEYNGGYYNSFHFRNCGSANNQCHSGGWYTYDDKNAENYAANKDAKSKNTIAYKLLGKYYNGTSLFKNVSVSVRYVMDWKNGNKIYMRVNDKKSYSQGDWVLVSEFSKNGDARDFLDPRIGGAGIALKTGATQNGYIDNIIIWSGTCDEPADKSSPFLTSKTEGHLYKNINGKNICLYCGDYDSYEAIEWQLSGIPEYEGGRRSDKLYLSGQGMHDFYMQRIDEVGMELISKTNPDEFKNYLGKLEREGFSNVYAKEDESGSYAMFVKNGKRVYTYYTAAEKVTRVIDDGRSDCSPAEFGYSYQKRKEDHTVLYQYGLPMNSEGVGGFRNGERKTNCGMMYVIKLADNSVFIVDGGSYQQFDEKQTDGFMRFLENITGVGPAEKIRISGWFITHTHQDHMAGFCLFIQKYSSRIKIERIMCNLPSVFSDTPIFQRSRDTYSKLLKYIHSYCTDDFQFIKLHTGEEIQLADAKIRVLYTHEDIVDPKTGISQVGTDLNNSSTVLRIEFDGKSFLILGDINRPAMNIILDRCPHRFIKCDVIQIAHHVFNNLIELYDVAQAPVVLVPQAPAGGKQDVLNASKKYVKDNMIFHADKFTFGIEVKNGKFRQTFSEEVHGGEYGKWGW